VLEILSKFSSNIQIFLNLNEFIDPFWYYDRQCLIYLFLWLLLIFFRRSVFLDAIPPFHTPLVMFFLFFLVQSRDSSIEYDQW
jgi:hypothetical protein